MATAPAPSTASSFWLDSLPDSADTCATVPASTNVVIIGAGIAGASIAYHMAMLGVPDVVLVESRKVAHGATGRNGGHLSPSIALEGLAARVGMSQALAVLKHEHANFAAVVECVRTHGIHCDLDVRGTAKLFYDAAQLRRYAQAAEELHRHGVGRSEVWDAERCKREFGTDAFAGAVYNPDAASLVPAALVRALVGIAAEHGTTLVQRTHVVRLRAVQASHAAAEQPGVVVSTNRGDIVARSVVVATNAYTAQLLPEMHALIRPVRGQVVVTTPLPRCMPCNFSVGSFEYGLQRQDGRLVIGGQRQVVPGKQEWVTDDATTHPAVSRGLRAWIGSTFPAARSARVEHEWSGIMGFSADGQPWVGPLPRLASVYGPGAVRATGGLASPPPPTVPSNLYICAGFTGHGMVGAFLSGRTIAEMVAGLEPTCLMPSFLPSARTGALPSAPVAKL